jgi:hypothetical protein
VQDLRHALTSFRRNLTFTAAAVVALAVAIGVTTFVYSLVYAVPVDAAPHLGRWFNETDALPHASRVVVLSHGLWQERLWRKT